MKYLWKFQMEERNYKEVESYTELQQRKKQYIQNYLKPALVQAEAGWDGTTYYVMLTPSGYMEEWVTLECGSSVRYYNVTGCSTGAIARTVFENIFD